MVSRSVVIGQFVAVSRSQSVGQFVAVSRSQSVGRSQSVSSSRSVGHSRSVDRSQSVGVTYFQSLKNTGADPNIPQWRVGLLVDYTHSLLLFSSECQRTGSSGTNSRAEIGTRNRHIPRRTSADYFTSWQTNHPPRMRFRQSRAGRTRHSPC